MAQDRQNPTRYGQWETERMQEDTCTLHQLREEP